MRDLSRTLLAFFAVLILNLFIASPKSQAATALYVAQAAAGAADGSSCANAKAVSALSGSWAAGNTIHLCGTITSVIQVGGNGTAANPIVLQWEQGAKLSVCDTNGALQIPNNSYVTVDLGGNSAAITCANNGSGLSSQVEAIGITSNGTGWNQVEIRNGTVGPMFVYSGTSSGGFNSICINGGNGANNTYVHNVSLTGCAEGIEIDPTSNTTDQFAHLTVDGSVGRVLNYASGTSSAIASTNSSFHDNDVNYTTVWSVPAGYQHYETLHIYNTGNSGSQDSIQNFQIYNNYFHGASPTNSGSTAMIFVGEGGSSCSASSYAEVKIFDNLITDSGNSNNGFSSGTGSYIYSQDCEHTLSVYNNTIDAGSSSNACFRALNTAGTTGNSWTVKNNICIGANWSYYNDVNEPLTASNNIYYNIGSGGWTVNGKTYNTLSSWQSASGQDAASSTSAPGLNSDYTVTGTASLAHSLPGVNLTSLNVAALDIGKPPSVGAASSATGTPRAASGSWDVGAYTLGSAQVTLPNAPTGLTATVN